jgi:hypothetical protein
MAFAAVTYTAVVPATVARKAIRAMEDSLDKRFGTMWPDNPVAVVGPARGVYLEGYGAVFTTELNLANEGVALMHPFLTTQEKAQVVKKKIDRVPQLRKALQEALMGTAASLDAMPPDEQVVIQVVLDRFSWEEAPTYPAEVIAQSTRQKLLDVKKANGAGIDAAVRITEH